MVPLVIVTSTSGGYSRCWCHPSVGMEQVAWLAGAADVVLPLETEPSFDKSLEGKVFADQMPGGGDHPFFRSHLDQPWPEVVGACVDRLAGPVSYSPDGVPIARPEILDLPTGCSWHYLTLALCRGRLETSAAVLAGIQEQVKNSLLPEDWTLPFPFAGLLAILDVDYGCLVTRDQDLLLAFVASHLRARFDVMSNSTALIAARWALEVSGGGITLERAAFGGEGTRRELRLDGRFGRGSHSLLTAGDESGDAFTHTIALG